MRGGVTVTEIKIEKSTCPTEARPDIDHYITFKVVWGDRRPVVVYLMVTGKAGGYVEIKVDEDTRNIHQVIVIDDPPPAGRVDLDGVEIEHDSPALTDLGFWPFNPDLQLERRSACIDADLSYHQDAHSRTVIFSRADVARVLRSGPVRVGVCSWSTLVSVSIDLHVEPV